MARYRDAVCKQCRRENVKLFLKGERCLSDKCAMEKRPFAPGEHGRRRPKGSEYSVQLREKQKAKRTYGLLEKQFRNYYYLAVKQKGITGENLLQLLETRLDNVVYRLSFAFSRNEARQMVRHNHLSVNGKSVNIPSYRIRPGDVISINEKSGKVRRVKELLKSGFKSKAPDWLQLDEANLSGKILRFPSRDDIDAQIQEQLIVELYSK
ncbi:MAG: 30S ribosomal protein S4 [Actinobacteria bacterium]|nr:30S ribosomal protein S4 [Actinomycetota bacterium]